MSWQDEFRLKNLLLQADVETFELALSRLPAAVIRARTGAAWYGAALRAAIEAGWINAPECSVLRDDSGKRVWMYGGRRVRDMHPAAVQWLGQRIETLYNETMSAVPKEI